MARARQAEVIPGLRWLLALQPQVHAVVRWCLEQRSNRLIGFVNSPERKHRASEDASKTRMMRPELASPFRGRLSRLPSSGRRIRRGRCRCREFAQRCAENKRDTYPRVRDRCSSLTHSRAQSPTPNNGAKLSQPAAPRMSSAILFSTAGVISSTANDVGHICPSSSCASSLKPSVQ